MRMAWIIFAIMGSINLYAATELRIVDKKIEFATATVNDIVAWTVVEKDALVNQYKGTSTATVIYYSPSANEVNLSTCVKPHEYRTCQTKAGLIEKLKELKIEIDVYTDLKVAVPADLQHRYDWLKYYYGTLTK